ncbi:PK1L2-like protein, partial [Mya arenaria]
YLSHVYIKDLQAGSSWTFIYKDWLAVDRGSLLHTSATVTATSQTELRKKRQHNFMVKTSQDLRDGHLWISIFSKRARSTFTRVQRLTCALSLLLTTMLTNIMFYGVSTDDPSDQVGAAGGWVISLSAIVIGIESSLIMFPVNLLVLQLFLKLKSRPTEAEVRATSRRYKERAGFIDRLMDAGQEMAEQCYTYISLQKKNNAKSSLDIPCAHVQPDVESAGHRGIPDIQVGSDSTMDIFESTNSFLPTIQEVDETQADAVISPSMSPGDFGLADTEMAENTGSKTTFPKIRVTSESKNNGKFLPWWFLYVAWVLVLMVSLVSSYFVMLYGLKYGYQRSLEWLVSFLTGFTQSAFLTQPLKVFAIAMVLTLLFKKTVEFDDFGPEISIDEDEKYVNGVCELPEVNIPYNKPLSESLLKQIKDRIKLEWLMDMTLRDLLLYFVYLGVLLVVVHGHREVRTAYLNTLALEDVLVNPGCVNTNLCFFLEKADKVETFYQYLHEVAIPSLADMSEADHEFATPGSSHFLLGPWRIRQTRVTKGDYNSSWAHRLPKGSGAGTWWGYQSAWQLKTLPITGSLATYYGGGYVITMPADTTLHAGIVEEMWNSDWLDEHTRAVMIEFTLYNPNADLFSPMVLLFEFSRSGAILPSHQFFSTNLFHYSTDFATFVAVCEVMFLCFNISFTYFEWKKLKVLGRKAYFEDFWNYIELLQMGLSYSVVGLFFQRMLSVSSALEEYGASGETTYISFTTAIFWNSVLNYVMAFLVGLVTLKSIKLLQFNKRTFMIFDTLNHTKGMIGSFIMMAVLFTVAYASLGVLAFGTVQHGYREMFTSLMTVFNFALGVSDLPGLQGTNRILGPAFFVSFVFLVQFCFMTIFVAILNFGISESKALFEKRKNKFELVEYVLSKIKTIADSS